MTASRLVVFLILAIPAAVSAEPRDSSYGGSIAYADAAAVGLGLATVALTVDCLDDTLFVPDREQDNTRCTAAALTGAATVGAYAIAPAVIHWREGRGGRAAVSLGLRLGLPLAGYAAGSAIGGDAAGAGALLGALAAMVVDWSTLSRRVSDTGPSITPAIGPRGTFGVAGQF